MTKEEAQMNCPRCGANVDEHPANRCLDAWVAEAVMGKPPSYYHCPHFDERGRMLCFCSCPSLPQHSTSIADAWEVAEKLPSPVEFYRHDPDNNWHIACGEGVEWGWGSAPELPLALCRAALKAVSG